MSDIDGRGRGGNGRGKEDNENMTKIITLINAPRYVCI